MSMILDGTNGATFNDGSLQAAAASPYVLKNRIINGDMRIDQRNAGASVVNSDNTYCLDRYVMRSTVATTYTVQQNAGSVTPPAGFNNYLGLTSTSSYSFTGNQYFGINQYIEGYNVADLNWGTANAKTITVSFWVRSSLTGNFDLTIWNESFARGYVTQYTISAANTWTYITVTIPGDTSGTWQKTTATGIALFFSIGASGTYATSTLNTWGGSYTGSTTGTKVVSTNGATWYITGVQVEIGSTATPFERRLYNQELANCQRYYWEMARGSLGTNGTNSWMGEGGFYSTSQYNLPVMFPVTMRTSPSLNVSNTSAYFKLDTPTGQTFATFTIFQPSIYGTLMYATGLSSSGTAGYACGAFTNNASAFCAFSAEL